MPLSLKAGCSLNTKEELTAFRPKKGFCASQVLLKENRCSWRRMGRLRRTWWKERALNFLSLSGASHRSRQQGERGRLTLEQTPRSSLADRWSWTAVLKRWPSRRKNSSGSYIPVKGVVRSTGALNISIMSRLVLFCLTGVMLATYSYSKAGSCTNTEHQKYHPPSIHWTLYGLWHFFLVFLTFMYLWWCCSVTGSSSIKK